MLSELAFESAAEDEPKRSAEGGRDLQTTGIASKVPTVPPKPQTKAPIITFDNHDPEFDEDSDPDGDLAF
jgi:hypothetical protein